MPLSRTALHHSPFRSCENVERHWKFSFYHNLCVVCLFQSNIPVLNCSHENLIFSLWHSLSLSLSLSLTFPVACQFWHWYYAPQCDAFKSFPEYKLCCLLFIFVHTFHAACWYWYNVEHFFFVWLEEKKKEFAHKINEERKVYLLNN